MSKKRFFRHSAIRKSFEHTAALDVFTLADETRSCFCDVIDDVTDDVTDVTDDVFNDVIKYGK
jgi:hypothetical protein